MPRVAESPKELSVPEDIPVESPAVPVMVGTYFHQLDEKKRVIIPARLRLALTDEFWMMLDGDNNVALYDSATGYNMLRRCEELTAENPDDEEIAKAIVRITGTAELVTAESGWRVSIPEILRYWAKLDKEVVTVGGLNHAVLWNRDKWEIAQTEEAQDAAARRLQAGIMRAAASTIKKKSGAGDDQGQTSEIAAAQAGPRLPGLGSLGRSGSAAAAGDAQTASAGDGSRSSRLLALSRAGG